MNAYGSDTAAGLYESLATQRQPYLDRAREAANFTIPALLPPEGHNATTDLSRGYQSLGARGVTSLSAKMLQSLFPTSQPNFQLKADIYAVQKLQEQEGGEVIINELKANLARIETAVMNEFDSKGLRPQIHESFRQLIVAGNCLVNYTSTGKLKVFKMDRYVVKRTPEGDPICIIIKETTMPAAIPSQYHGLLQLDEDDGVNTEVDIYTKIVKRDDDMWEVVQEVKGVEIEETRGTEDRLNYLPLRLEPVTGEDYGYGYVSQLIGDLESFEHLTESLVNAATAASKLVFMVSPTATATSPRDLAECDNGAIIEGNEGDVTMLTLGNKSADLSVAFQAAQGIRERLEASFMLNSSVQRTGDRVTATEIQAMVEELEVVLAGAYSLLAIEYQLPLVELVMNQMVEDRRLPDVPKEYVLPTITTGLNALGRGSELNRLDSFVGAASQILGPVALEYINVPALLDRRLTALGLLNDGLLKSQEQLQAEQQQAQQQALVQQFGNQVLESGLQGGEQPPQQ